MTMSDLSMKAIELLSPLLLLALTWGAAALANYFRAKIKNEYLRGALTRLDDAVVAAVKEAQQVTVAAIREASADGTITEAEKESIKAKVLAVVRSHIGMKGLGELAKILGLEDGAVTGLISSKIEAAVLDLKAREAAIENPPAPPKP